MRRLFVDWKDLGELGNTTEDNILAFEKARLIFENELETLIECWTGNDSAVFQNKTIEYLEGLKTDVDYIYEWSRYFKRKSRTYEGTEESSLQRMRSVFDQMDDTKKEQ